MRLRLTPRLGASVNRVASSAFGGALRGFFQFNALGHPELHRAAFEAPQPLLSPHLAELTGAAIPGDRLIRIAADAAYSGSRRRIKCCSQPQRRAPITRIRGAFVKETRGT